VTLPFVAPSFSNCLRHQRDVLAGTMPIREIPCPIVQVPTDVPVYIIVVDKEGVERQEQGDLERKVPDGCLLSDLVKDHMLQNPPTDVFLVSHGFNADQKSAEKDFQDWVEHMTKPDALPGLFDMHTKRGRAFKPLVVCVHWPSKYMAKLRALLSDWHLPSAGVELVRTAPGLARRSAVVVKNGAEHAFHYAKAQQGNIFRKPYGKSRSQKPAYSYRELCRFPKVWDAPQGPSGDPSIPEKTGISETMTGVSDLLTAKNRHTWAHDDRENQGLRQSSVTRIRSFYHRPNYSNYTNIQSYQALTPYNSE